MGSAALVFGILALITDFIGGIKIGSYNVNSYSNYYSASGALRSTISDAKSLCMVGMIFAALAIIFGIVGIVTNSRRRESLGTSITGLVMGCVSFVSMLIVFLISIAL